MLFSKLLDLPFDSGTNKIDLRSIRSALPATPLAVSCQVYEAHGRNSAFQALYGSLDIQKVKWQLRSMRASTLCRSSYNPLYASWVESVTRRLETFQKQGWHCVDRRNDVAEHWGNFQSWQTPPVLILGKFLPSKPNFHFVEGHTRLGVLRGLLEHKVLAQSSRHLVWLGCCTD